MNEIVFDNLRMSVVTDSDPILLSLSVDSGHIEFEITLSITARDLAVIESDEERRTFLQAALHQPFQLKETNLNETDQRQYLDAILHAPAIDTEGFLSELDHGRANGAISNMVRITLHRDATAMRDGKWFLV